MNNKKEYTGEVARAFIDKQIRELKAQDRKLDDGDLENVSGGAEMTVVKDGDEIPMDQFNHMIMLSVRQFGINVAANLFQKYTGEKTEFENSGRKTSLYDTGEAIMERELKRYWDKRERTGI